MRKVDLALCLSFLAILTVGCGRSGEDPRTGDLIDGVIEAYGGLERLREVRGYRMEGQLFAVQRAVQVRTERWFQRPDRLRVELDYPDGIEVRYTEGEHAWVDRGDGQFEPAQPLMVQSMRLQTLRMDFPLRLHERRLEVEDLGLDDEGLHRLKLRIDDDLAMTWHVDPATHRAPLVTLEMVGPPAMTFSARYELFHLVDGVLVAFRERTYSGTVQTSEFQTTDFEIDPEGLDRMARPPSDI